MITAKTKICLIIGDPVEHSLSPLMHNAAYKSLGIDSEYVFLATKVESRNLDSAMRGLRSLNVTGISCTAPHKVAVMEHLDKVDHLAKKIGAVNTVVNDNGILTGYNTDWIGVTAPFAKITNLKNKKVAIIGAGGAARAAVFGFTNKGAYVKIFNRTVEKAKSLANDFAADFAGLNELPEINKFDIIFNATTIGTAESKTLSPVPKEYLNANQIVFDAIYSPLKTILLKDAKNAGAKTISGLEMLLHQGIAQFELYVGQKAPEKIMRQVLMETI